MNNIISREMSQAIPLIRLKQYQLVVKLDKHSIDIYTIRKKMKNLKLLIVVSLLALAFTSCSATQSTSRRECAVMFVND